MICNRKKKPIGKMLKKSPFSRLQHLVDHMRKRKQTSMQSIHLCLG